MGTHPIFESDFDCLTDMSRPTDDPGPWPDFGAMTSGVTRLDIVTVLANGNGFQLEHARIYTSQNNCVHVEGVIRHQEREPGNMTRIVHESSRIQHDLAARYRPEMR